jgi:hypothetical protein
MSPRPNTDFQSLNGEILFGLWVLDHFTEKSFYRFFLTERHLTETPFDRTPFDRKFILPKGHMTDFFFRNWSFDRINLRQKMSFNRKKIAQKVV